MTPDEFENMLIKHEGFNIVGGKHRLYEDTVGKLTLGYGHNVEDNGISDAAAMFILREDIAQHAKELADHFPIVRDLDSARYYVLVNMCFNLGIVRLAKFKKMWAYITDHNWHSASLEMLDSKWANQVGNRAIELSELMKHGD